MVDIVNTVVEGEASLQVEPELPTPVDDDLTSAQDSVIDIVEDDSTTTEDKVIQITDELSEQVPDIPRLPPVLIDEITRPVQPNPVPEIPRSPPVLIDKTLPVQPNPVPDISEDDIRGILQEDSLPYERGEYNNDLQQFHSMLANGFVSSLS